MTSLPVLYYSDVAYDWLGDNIYWLNTGNTTNIEMARSDGSHRRVIVTLSAAHSPTLLTLAPKNGYSRDLILRLLRLFMCYFIHVLYLMIHIRFNRLLFWADVDANGRNARIMRANMDGSDIKELVAGSDHVRRPAGDWQNLFSLVLFVHAVDCDATRFIYCCLFAAVCIIDCR